MVSDGARTIFLSVFLASDGCSVAIVSESMPRRPALGKCVLSAVGKCWVKAGRL